MQDRSVTHHQCHDVAGLAAIAQYVVPVLTYVMLCIPVRVQEGNELHVLRNMQQPAPDSQLGGRAFEVLCGITLQQVLAYHAAAASGTLCSASATAVVLLEQAQVSLRGECSLMLL